MRRFQSGNVELLKKLLAALLLLLGCCNAKKLVFDFFKPYLQPKMSQITWKSPKKHHVIRVYLILPAICLRTTSRLTRDFG